MERKDFAKERKIGFVVFFIFLFVLIFSIGYLFGINDKECEKITIEILPPKTLNNFSRGFAGPVQPWCDKEFFTQYGYCNQTEVKK